MISSHQNGVKEPMLCDECEGRISRLEDVFINKFLKQNPADVQNRGGMRKLRWSGYNETRLCLLSIAWRMIISSSREMQGYEFKMDAGVNCDIRNFLLRGANPMWNHFPILVRERIQVKQAADPRKFITTRYNPEEHIIGIGMLGYEFIIILQPHVHSPFSNYSINYPVMRQHCMFEPDHGTNRGEVLVTKISAERSIGEIREAFDKISMDTHGKLVNNLARRQSNVPIPSRYKHLLRPSKKKK